MSHQVTAAWLHAHRTAAGGWRRDQLAVLGVAWPPTSGWLRNACGRVITDAERDTFERAARPNEAPERWATCHQTEAFCLCGLDR